VRARASRGERGTGDRREWPCRGDVPEHHRIVAVRRREHRESQWLAGHHPASIAEPNSVGGEHERVGGDIAKLESRRAAARDDDEAVAARRERGVHVPGSATLAEVRHSRISCGGASPSGETTGGR
jgi:hypothetical protein